MVQAAQERANPPSPIPILGGFRDLEEVNREVFCHHYSRCLDHAAGMDWPAFSCQECRAFLPVQSGPEEWLQEATSCRRLIEYVLRDLPPAVEALLQGNERKDFPLRLELGRKLLIKPAGKKHFDGGEDKLLRVNSAARRLGRSPHTVRRLYDQGKLAGVRPSERGIRLYESSVEAYRIEMQG